MLDQQKMMQEAFNMGRNYWKTTMDMASTFQEQNEKMWNNLLEQSTVAQQEGKKMLQEWLDRSRQAQEEVSRTMEDNWKNAERMFGGNGSAKTGK